VKRHEVEAIFLLADIRVFSLGKVDNEYWPDTPTYAKLRQESPWWIVQTELGTIKLGWRRRVIALDWSETKMRKWVTPEDVQQTDTSVHASSHGKAVDYLSNLRPAAVGSSNAA
jgi:hypothetical protein